MRKRRGSIEEEKRKCVNKGQGGQGRQLKKNITEQNRKEDEKREMKEKWKKTKENESNEKERKEKESKGKKRRVKERERNKGKESEKENQGDHEEKRLNDEVTKWVSGILTTLIEKVAHW